MALDVMGVGHGGMSRVEWFLVQWVEFEGNGYGLE